MISTSIIRSTGEKKWMPTKFFGRAEFFASDVMGMVEVLEAKIADEARVASVFSVAAFLKRRDSEHRLDDEVGGRPGPRSRRSA